MIDNPIYSGNYLAQAKAEIDQFRLILDLIQIQKTEGQEYDQGNRTQMDLNSFPLYSFHHFQKYTEERLSSAHPKTVLSELDEIYISTQKCISQYCQIIEKKITETEKIFKENAFYNSQNLAVNDLIFFKQARFCFLIKDYYRNIQKLFGLENTMSEKQTDIDYIKDVEKVREILGKDFDDAIEKSLEIFIDHILFYKYGKSKPQKMPDIHIHSLSQRDLIKIGKAIIKKFEWNSKARRYIADIFGQLIYRFDNFKPVRYNSDTIYKGL